ncbi:hypothetical protein HPB48_022274 [Haemaphysalis longicornis]|uniref:Uncharacterized protein n=1 Tax=Haemaphysalis longicornis TaxID=44386 RepID=A0A9J6GA82_HAELO|nr:hypothetical protein HPB48_022274 [Haemaphysalis longicornis]
MDHLQCLFDTLHAHCHKLLPPSEVSVFMDECNRLVCETYCERGFSENKFALQHRSSMSITSVTAMRQTKTYLKRYEGDVTKVEITAPLLKYVREARQRNLERLKSEKETSKSAKRKHESKKSFHKKDERTVLTDEKQDLFNRVPVTQVASRQCSRNKEMGKVESGNAILDEANTTLPKVMKRFEEIDAVFSKHN